MISVQHNMLAENANRQFNVNTKKNAKLAEKLSSGYKINRAADDAAGLAVSEKMRRQVRGISQAADNIKDGIGYVQTAEGALNEAQDILQRVNELAVKAANGTNTVSDRAYINSEVQQLKAELSRIFSTTTFNEQRIWEPDEVTPLLGHEPKTAVRISGYGFVPGNNVTEANCEVLPKGLIAVNKEDDGIKVEWTGYNGIDYSTGLITWKDIEDEDYCFDIAKYFDKNNADLFPNGPNGEALFSYTVNIGIEEGATLQQVKDAVGEIRYISTSHRINLYGNNGNGNTSLGAGVSYSRGTLDYEVAYNLHLKNIYNFDGNNDKVIEPDKIANNGKSNLISYPDDTFPGKEWVFSFEMDGIGTVTATSDSVSYFSSDNHPQWWIWDKNGNKLGNKVYSPSPSDGTLENALNTLKKSKPALLNPDDSKSGGTISLNFTMRDAGGGYIGEFSIGVGVSANDNESSVSARITSALKESTVLDLYTNGASDSVSLYNKTLSSGTVQIPVYGQTILQGKENFWVQAGAEAGQHIDIEYESLSLYALGMQDTDTLTVESASRAINEVKGALQIVSDQRSLFGAYQNRLEHAYNINKNVEENTQASESLIRDTDIADAMMEYSINNILLQAGTSMLTQANQSSQLITQLLG